MVKRKSKPAVVKQKLTDDESKKLQRASTEELSDVEQIGNRRKRKILNNSPKCFSRSTTADTVDIDKIVTGSPTSPKLIKLSTPPKGRVKKSGKGKKGGKSALGLKDLFPEGGWKDLLEEEFEKEYMKDLESKLLKDYQNNEQIFPPKEEIFNAFNLTPLNKLKIIILGQDPYHGDKQAHGLSFSVPKGVAVPPSLKNVYKELTTDIEGFKAPDHGCLEGWANQGVLLLNATLTVKAHQANSHSKYGWQEFTTAVIRSINDHCEGVVFVLWGGFAHKKQKLLDPLKHSVISTAHPSGLSFGKFRGCRCFSAANSALKRLGKIPIDWGAL